MDAITYETKANRRGKLELRVRLGRKIVGQIKAHEGGFRYVPTGATPGETFATVAEVKASLHGS